MLCLQNESVFTRLCNHSPGDLSPNRPAGKIVCECTYWKLSAQFLSAIRMQSIDECQKHHSPLHLFRTTPGTCFASLKHPIKPPPVYLLFAGSGCLSRFFGTCRLGSPQNDFVKWPTRVFNPQLSQPGMQLTARNAAVVWIVQGGMPVSGFSAQLAAGRFFFGRGPPTKLPGVLLAQDQQ